MFLVFADILHIDCVCVVGRCVIVAWCRASGCSLFTQWPTYCDSGEKERRTKICHHHIWTNELHLTSNDSQQLPQPLVYSQLIIQMNRFDSIYLVLPGPLCASFRKHLNNNVSVCVQYEVKHVSSHSSSKWHELLSISGIFTYIIAFNNVVLLLLFYFSIFVLVKVLVI